MSMPRNSRDLADNIVALPSKPNAPPSSLDEPEKVLWRRITHVYAIDDPGSQEVLETALQARGRMRRCRQCIDEDGETIRDRYNVHRAHPLLVGEARARFLPQGAAIAELGPRGTSALKTGFSLPRFFLLDIRDYYDDHSMPQSRTARKTTPRRIALALGRIPATRRQRRLF